MFKATLSTVRDGFSYEREQVLTRGWIEFMEQLEYAMLRVSDGNPDSVLIKFERPANDRD